MKRKVRSIVWLGVFASLWATTADAQLLRRTPEKLDGRIDKMKVFFEELQGSGSKIPKAILQKAQGLIVMRQIKVGVGVGAQVGAGVATVRDPASGQWSVPAFVNNMEGSYGLQIGGQKSDTVILLMNDEGMEVLRRGGLRFGVDVRATAGPVSGGADLKMDTIKEPILVYTNAGGFFAGAALEGGGIGTAVKSNANYYGATMEGVLFRGEGRLTEAGREFLQTILRYQ